MTRRLAAQIGFIIGLFVACIMFEGGRDGVLWFWRDWFPGATAPAYAYLFTAPFGWLPYPANFALFAGLSAICVMWACQRFGITWLIILTPPVLSLLWLGQLEALVVLGAVLAAEVGQGDRAAVWAGPAWLLLMAKPTVGIGLALWLLWRLWKQDGAVAVWVPAVVVIAALLLTLVLWGSWGADWLHVMTHFDEPLSHDNFGGWPYGAILLLLLALPGVSPKKQPALIAALTFFLVPYTRIYHLTPLLVLAGSPLLIGVTWLATALGVFYKAPLYMLWLPGLVLAFVLWRVNGRGQTWRFQRAI